MWWRLRRGYLSWPSSFRHAGTTLAPQCAAALAPADAELLLTHQGDQTLAIELVGRDGRVWHGVRSSLKDVATPFELKAEVSSASFAPAA